MFHVQSTRRRDAFSRSRHPGDHLSSDLSSPLVKARIYLRTIIAGRLLPNMTDNPSFILRGVEDVVFDQLPIPESKCCMFVRVFFTIHRKFYKVLDDEVLVAVKKTGRLSLRGVDLFSATQSAQVYVVRMYDNLR